LAIVMVGLYSRYIGSLADIDHGVQESPRAAKTQIQHQLLQTNRAYCRTGGGLVGQGEAGCAGDAVIGAGAAGCGRALVFFAAGFLAGGFLVALGGAAGVSSTTTGFVPKRGGSPVCWIMSSCSDAGAYPFRVNVTVIGDSTGNASEQGVRQLWPLDALASAPGGSDSRLIVSSVGPDLNAPKLIQSGDDEHAVSATAPPTITRTRYIILTVPLERLEAARPSQG
jgi:hypothetical protein